MLLFITSFITFQTVQWTHYENTPIQIYCKFHHQKLKVSDKFFFFFLIFLLKTFIVDIRLNRLAEAVLTRTHNLFLSRNKKSNVYPCKPQFYNIKVGFERVKII